MVGRLSRFLLDYTLFSGALKLLVSGQVMMKNDGIFRFPVHSAKLKCLEAEGEEKKIEDIETWLAFLHLQPACLSESPRSVVSLTNCRHRWALYRSETFFKPPKGPTKCWGRDFEETCKNIGPFV